MLDQNVVKRLTVIATEQGLTSLNTKLAQTNRLYDQGTASAARYATATGNLDRHMQALLRQRDRYASAFNTGGIGGMAGRAGADAGMFAVSRVLPFTAAVGAAAVAVAGLNALFEHGAALVEKYTNAQREVDRSDLVSNLEALTKFQGDTISAAQVQYATELGNRLADAKFTIDQFFKVHLDVNDAALKMQAVWVGIAEALAKGAGHAETLVDKLKNIPSGFWDAAARSMPFGIGHVYTLGSTAANYMAVPAPPAPSLEQSRAAARAKLGAAMGVANIGKDGAPIGDSFSARFGDAIHQLSNVGKKQEEVAETVRNAWTRALDSISKSIAMQEAEAQGVGATAGQMARLKVEAQLVEAGLRSGMTESAIKASEAYQRLGERAERAADSLARLKLVNALQFERDQLGRSDIDQKIASRLKSAGLEVNLNSVEAEMIRVNEQLKLGKDLATDFVSGFARDMMNGVSATEALNNALKRLAGSLMDMAVKNLVNQAFGGLFGGLINTTGVGLHNAGEYSLAFPKPIGSPVAHSGGIIGVDAFPTRYVHPAYFENAPRYHGGGIAGLRPDEVPAILQRGERVVPRSAAQDARPAIMQVKLINENGPVMQAVDHRVNEEGELEIRMRAVARDELASGRTNGIMRAKHGAGVRLKAR